MELLVVIGIIALLISILLPSLNKARRAAQAVACASNMRQVGIAMQFYVNDTKGMYPLSFQYRTASYYPDFVSTAIRWDDLLIIKGYIANSGILLCPIAQQIQVPYLYDYNGKQVLYDSHRNYGVAVFGIGGGNNPSWNWYDPAKFIGIRQGQIKDSAARIAVGEADEQGYPNNNGFRMNGDTAYSLYGVPAKWHSGGGNYLYLDGHVTYKKFEEVAWPNEVSLYIWFYPNQL
ncbi:MAG: hypothetical protein IT447_07215 [Phycisphaerales bacterium]|nr:hypothetical protein [Phycisphaerales bacterium]